MNFKSFFINEDIKTSTSVKPISNNIEIAVAPTIVQPGAAITVDKDIKAALLQSLQDNKLAGFDYLKFVAALEEMKEIGGTEEARLKMTFITAKQLGVDKTKLIESANHYLEVLKKDAVDFSSNLADKQAKNIGVNEKRLEDVEKATNNHRETITTLNAEIEKLQQEKYALTVQIADERARLENKKSAFEYTHTSLTNEIKDNIQKINQYLN